MNEDFVSFELAKKIKEKGFREKCLCHYIVGNLIYNIESPIANNQLWFCHNKYDNIWHRNNVDAPTISQVLKWLREEKKISIQPLSVRGGTWEAQITFTDCNDVTLKKMFEDKSFWTDDRFTSYEQAAIAGLEYVLNNLI